MHRSHYCYLLNSKRLKTHTYIGYTYDPIKRLRQHNGEKPGGAKYTRRYRPWKHKLIVCGLRNQTEGLQFEWAWKHPYRTRFLKGIKKPKSTDKLAICKLLCSQPSFSHCKIIKY